MPSRGFKAVLAVCAAALVVPAASEAATKTVVAGPLKPVKGVFGRGGTADADTFSLPTVTIRAGDSVRWKFNGFHTVTFPKKGGGAIPFIIPDASAKYTGFNDPAGAPFWFNGQTQLDANPLGALPQGGKSYDGSAVTGSGAPLGAAKPYTLKFPKTGTFTYYCVVHPGMKAKVKVVPKGKAIPSKKADAKTASKLLAKQVKVAKKTAKLTTPAGTVVGGNDKGQVVQFRFFPKTLHVAPGSTVTFKVTSKPEIHTFSFGPQKFLEDTANGFVTPVNGALQFSPVIAFPSDPPPAVPSYDGTSHGNGFISTGVLDGDPATPNPTTAKITFTKAGSYGFICLIHPFMQGTVVVG
jgi:plastocyanin